MTSRGNDRYTEAVNRAVTIRSRSGVTLSPYRKTNSAERRPDARPGHSDKPSKAKAVTTQRAGKMTCASAPACAAHPPATQGERGAAARPPARAKRVPGSVGPADSVPECGAPQVYLRRQTASALIPVRIKKTRERKHTNVFIDPREDVQQAAPSDRSAETRPHPGVPASRREEASPARRIQVGAYNHQNKDTGLRCVTRQIDTLVLMDKSSSDASSESEKEPGIASSIQPLPESLKDPGTPPLDDNYEAPENVRSGRTPRHDNEESVSGPSGASDIPSKLKTEPRASHKDIDRSSRDRRGTRSFSSKEIPESSTSSREEVRAADTPPVKEILDVGDLSFVGASFREDADDETTESGEEKMLKPNAEQENISGHQNRDGLQVRAQRIGENGREGESGEDEEHKAEGTAHRFPREGGIFQTSITRVHYNSDEMMPEGKNNTGETPEPGEISINSARRNDPCTDATAGDCPAVVPDIGRGAARCARGEVQQTKPDVDQIKDGDSAWTSATKEGVVRRSRGILILTRSTEENAILIPKLKFEFTPDNSIDRAAFTHQGKGERKWSNAPDARPRTPHGPVVSKSILKRASLNRSPAGSGRVPLSCRVGGGSHGHPEPGDDKPPLYGIVDLSLSFPGNISAQAIPAGVPKISIPDEEDDES